MIAMNKKNIVMFDSCKEEAEDFIKGLEDSTGLVWKAKILNANKGRKYKIYNLFRYFKYFIFSFYHFLNRNKYNNVIGWQEFYGLIYAFYCRFFHVKKRNFLVIKNLIYKEKKGIIGKIYFKFMRYIIKSKYVDIFICSSRNYCKYISNIFDEDIKRFVFIPFGVNDFAKKLNAKKENHEIYALSLGRSNRDWSFLLNNWEKDNINLKIICDELKLIDNFSNIDILNNVWGEETFNYICNCKYMIIPILDGNMVAGETVLLQSMCFSKPIIITKPSSLADEYVEHLVNGIVIEKTKEDLNYWINMLENDKNLYLKLCENSRKAYDENYSLYSFGFNVGKLIKRSK